MVSTQDGYMLKLFRIPGSSSEPQVPNKPVVFFMHGLEDSADCWVVNHPEVAPAFVASRQGYDVWLGNNRGNKYSHTSVHPMSNKDFFNFSFIEMGDHDLPAMLDYVLAVTGQKKVAYVGHSQGTSQMFYALTVNEEYFAERVSVFAAIGPVTQMKHIKSTTVKTFADSTLAKGLLEATCNTLGFYDFFQPNWLETGSMRILCDTLPFVCKFMLYVSSDNDTALMD